MRATGTQEWGRFGAVTTLVAILIGLLPFVVGAQVAPAQVALSRPEPRLGRTAATQPLAVAIPLIPDTAALDAFLADVYDPRSPDYHHFLTSAEFTLRFVDGAARQAVVGFLQAQGLTVRDTGTGATVTVEGTAGQLERAFSVQLHDYRAADGHTFVAADRTPALPATLAARTRGVIGLDTATRRKPHLVRADLNAVGSRVLTANTASGCSGATNAANAYRAYTPNQLATAYGFDPLSGTGYQGEGQTVALFELDDYVDTNVTTWKSCFGITTPVTRVAVGGGAPLGGGQSEVELDIDVVTGLAPRLSQVLVYEAPNSDAGVVAEYQQIANDHAASVVSTSWGICEAANSTTARDAENTVFKQMAAQGMTVFAAAGDSGTDDCRNGTLAVDDPASQPYVSGTGGTNLTVSSSNAYASEFIWNNGTSGGGGGISTYWPRPAWQSGTGVTNTYSLMNGNRQVPDVAADADPRSGYIVYVQGQWTAYGGTSAAAPLWAAGTALVNERLVSGGSPPIGFGNPVWYRLLGQSATIYHDVTTGNNCVATTVPSCSATGMYPATAGYDQTSGVGTPNFSVIATALAPTPTIAGLTPTSGSTAGGTVMTITGTGFASGVSVIFGEQAATSVTRVSSTSLSVVTPQHMAGSVSVSVRNVGEMSITATTTFTYVMPVTLTPTPLPQPAVHITPTATASISPVSGAPATTVAPTATPLAQPTPHAPPATTTLASASAASGASTPPVATPLPQPARH